MIEVKDLELVVKEQLPGKLITNALQIKSFVEDKLKEYTPENYVGRADLAKEDRAVLNTAVKTLDGKRLELEKEFMKPFGEFKTIITDTVKTIKGASLKLDEIVKAEEEQEKEEKKEKIDKYFAGLNFMLLPLDNIFNQKWLNKTCKDKEWKTEIDNIITKIYADIKTLESFTEDSEILKAFYLESLDVAKAIEKGNQLKENRTALQAEKENRGTRECNQAHKTAVFKLEAEVVEELKETRAESVVDYATGEITNADAEMEITLKFYGKHSRLVALRQYMIDNNIRYEKL